MTQADILKTLKEEILTLTEEECALLLDEVAFLQKA